MTQVKICGIRDTETAVAAIAAGADYLGLNFVPGSKRRITPEIAASIVGVANGRANLVGVFQDAPLKLVNNLVQTLGLDYVQLHGTETAEYAKGVQAKIIKAVPVAPGATTRGLAARMQTFDDTIFLLDRSVQGKGAAVNLEVAKELARQFPCFLAGGLTPENVGPAIAIVNPYGVDVAGGVEKDGHIERSLVELFVAQAKTAAERLAP